MSVTRIARSPSSVLLIALTLLSAWVPVAQAKVGFSFSFVDSSTSNPHWRPVVRGLSAFQLRPLLEIATPARTLKVQTDSLFTRTKISLTSSGTHLLQPTVLTFEEYKQQKLRHDFQKLLRDERLKSFKQVQRQAGGQGIAIDVPFRIKSKTFRRLFGGDNVGVRVQGNISINGSVRRQKFDELQAGNLRNTNTSFRIDMVQQFTITGKVGQKVEVKVDQNSERLFDFENSLKLTYTGEEDEIVQKVEAGNVNLNLSGPRLATFSGRNQGLFGLKTEMKLGPLSLTSIASLERGQKNRQSPNKTTQRAQFSENDYLQNVYFWISSVDVAGDGRQVGNFRENYRRYFSRQHVEMSADQQLRDIEVYVSTDRLSPEGSEVFGRAVAIQLLNDVALPDTAWGRQSVGDHAAGVWRKLTKNTDYDFEPKLGYIRLKQPAPAEQYLACAFAVANGDTFGTLRPDSSRLVSLILLRSKDPAPTDSTWALMFRHVYSLRATSLDPNNFKLTISRDVAGGREETGPPLPDLCPAETQGSCSYLGFFGFDWEGQGGVSGPDGFVDNYSSLIDFGHGELHFLDLTPFNPSGIFRSEAQQWDTIPPLGALERNANDSAGFLRPYIYTSRYNQLPQSGSKWKFVTEFKGSTAVFDLGPLVLEGSEEVTLNGAPLQRGIDYTIDYLSGQLKILNESAKAAGANLEITYESGRTFQLDKTTLLGTRAEYGLWKDSYVGGMVLYLNQKTLDRRVRIGNEPIRNTLYDVNTRLKFKPDFLTRVIDAVPLIRTSAASEITVDGEYAMVNPNPNSLENPRTGDYNGLAFIDDFEGSRRATPLGLMRRGWTIASIPIDPQHVDSSRGRFRWWNPSTQKQVPVKEVYPERETNTQVAQTLQSLVLSFEPDTSTGRPQQSWGGAMRYLGEGYSDQSRSQYLEFWIRVPESQEGRLVVDLGAVSEDALPNDTMNSEDTPLPNQNTSSVQREYGNGLLDRSPDEDTGLDGIRGSDPSDVALWNGPSRPPIPSEDDWEHRSNSDDFDRTNGTEGSRDDESGGYPDTEDLNNNDFLDRANDYFSYSIDLRLHSPYIIGGQNNNEYNKKWRLFRIPLRPDSVMERDSTFFKVGSPDYSAIRWARLYLTRVTRPLQIELVQMDIVANEWLPVVSARDSTQYVSAAVINSHENPGYESPPGVSGERDPITNLQQREQSLVLKIDRLDADTSLSSPAPSEFFLAKNLYQDYNLLEYKRLKMFVHGGGIDDAVFPNNTYQVILRLGQNYSNLNSNYFDIVKTVHPGWFGNEIDFALNDLSLLHTRRAEAHGLDTLIALTGRFALAVGEPHSDDSLVISGSPTLQRIGFIGIGVRLHPKAYTGENDEIWVDELRVSDIYKGRGEAKELNVAVALADFIALNGGYSAQDADFHNVNIRINQSQASTESFRGNATVNLHKVALEKWGFRLPVTLSYNEATTIPRMIPSTGLRIDPQRAPDEIQSHRQQYSYRVQYSKTGNARNPFVRWSLEKLQASYDFTRDRSSDYNVRKATNEQNAAQVAYTFPTAKGRGVAPLFWIKRVPILRLVGSPHFYYKPTKLGVSAQGTRAMRFQETRPAPGQTRGIPSGSRIFNTSRNLNTGFQPFDPFNIDYSRTHKGILLDGGWERLFQYDFGRPTEVTQNLSNSYSPEFVSWLRPTLNYTTNYQWSHRNQAQLNGQTVANARNIGADLTLDFRTIFAGGDSRGRDRDRGRDRGGDRRGENPPGYEDLFKREQDRGNPNQPPPAGPGEGGAQQNPADSLKDRHPTAPDTSRRHFPAGTPPPAGVDSAKIDTMPPSVARRLSPFRMLGHVLSPLKKALMTLEPIALSVDNRADHSQAGTIGQAQLAYQLGFTQDPGLGGATDTAGNVFTQADARRRSLDYSARSGLRITRDLKTGFDYQRNESENISTVSTGSTEENVFWLPGKGQQVNKYPFVDVSVDWSGLEKLKLISKVAESVSLQTGLSGKMRENWSNDRSNVTSRDYTRKWDPLLGLNFGWKGNIDSRFRYATQRTYSVAVSQRSKSRQVDKNASAQVSYSITTGFKLPLVFMRAIRLQNQTTFSLSVDYASQRQESAEGLHTDAYAVRGATSSWSVQPSMTYSFSNTVRGQGAVKLEQRTNDVTKAKSRLFEFGIQVTIEIRG